MEQSTMNDLNDKYLLVGAEELSRSYNALASAMTSTLLLTSW